MHARLALVALFLTGCSQLAIPFSGHDFANSTLTASTSTAPADGVTPVALTLTLVDGDGGAVSGWAAQFNASDPNVSFTQPTGVSGNNGLLTATMTSTVQGPITVTATISQGATVASLPNSATVTFTLAAAVSYLQIDNVPTNVQAGQIITGTLSAHGNDGKVVTDYVGTLHFTSDDPNAILPADTTMTLGEAGQVAFRLSFLTSGSHVLMVQDVHNVSLSTAQRNIVVVTGPPTTFLLTTDANTYHVGSSLNLNVAVTDSYGNAVSSYAGTAAFSSTDPNATLPPPYTFSSGGSGMASFSNVIFTKAGPVTLTARDGINNLQGSLVLTGIPGTASSFGISAPSSTTAGSVNSMTCTAYDNYGNIATGYNGTVHFSSSDLLATLPQDTNFVAGSNGTIPLLNSVVFKSAGAQTLSATDTHSAVIHGTSSQVSVGPASATNLNFTGLQNGATAGAALTAAVQALDAYGNLATGYRGTVGLSTSDAKASLAPNQINFTAANAGVYSFTATFATAGNQNIKAQEALSGGITGIGNVTVSAGPLYALQLSALPSQANLGQHLALTLSAIDANNNTVTTYTNAVTFTSTDSAATIVPSIYTYTAADKGAKTFQVTFKTANSGSGWTVTATDAVAGLSATSTSVKVNTGGVANLGVSGFPASPSAGQQGNFVVQALDANNALLTGYLGTVTFSSSDPNAVFPQSTYTFTSTDAGTHTFPASLYSVGSQSITATDVQFSATGTQSGINVQPLAPVTLVVYGISGAQSGIATNFSVRAVDTYGNTAPGYTGLVTFTSSDANALLPSAYSFTTADNSAHTFVNGVTFKTSTDPNYATLTATDTHTPSFTSTVRVVVTHGPSARFNLSAIPSTLTAGQLVSPLVTVYDDSGNINTSYTGTVHFMSTDPNAILPNNYNFQAVDAGIHSFTNGLVLVTAQTTTVSINDTLSGGASATQTGIVVNPNVVSTFNVSGIPSPVAAGAVSSLRVGATDAYNNPIVGYTGTVTFSSTDSRAVLPARYTFVTGDNGNHSFINAVTLKSAGTQAVRVTDVSNSNVTGSQTPITVNGGVASSLKFMGLADAVANTPQTGVVSAYDGYANAASNYTGAVAFTSTDSQALLPNVYTFSTSDNGVHSFVAGFTLRSAGNQNITVTDSVNGFSALQNANVTAGPAQSMTITGLASSQIAGTPQSIGVKLFDAYNNTATSYSGVVSFSSTDTQATLPSNYSFTVGTSGDNGAHSFGATLKLQTAGSQNVTVADKSLHNTQAVTVGAGPTTSFSVSGPATASAGVANVFSVSANDSYGNVTPAYTGVVTFTSNDPNALLPANYSFPGSSATYPTSVTFEIPSNNSNLVVADVAHSTIRGSSGPVAVSGVASLGLAADSNANHMCAVMGQSKALQLKCWGLNTSGALGNGSSVAQVGNAINQMGPALAAVTFEGILTPTSYPQPVLAVGGNSTCVGLNDGSLRCFGDNSNGTLGYGDTINRGSTSASMGSALKAVNFGGATIVGVAVGQAHTCAIVSDNTVRCWGLNSSGQLGNGSSANANVPVATASLGSGRTATQITVGNAHSCALLDNGTVSCWGANASGQLGIGSTVSQSSPQAISIGTNRYATSIDAGYDHTCAVLDDHNVKCWGSNASGQLGVNTTTTANSAGSASEAILFQQNVKSVSAGNAYTCAVFQNGNMECWGNNASSQLGLGDTVTRGTCASSIFCMSGYMPTSAAQAYPAVGSGRTVQQVTTGDSTTCALLDNQEVKCWGNNAYGKAGSGASANPNAPPSNYVSLW